ncbi:MATE family efflux transporter [Kushneria phosphatilytica]|uniref:MATE family efflux transporter n=1 Tax=Kushneria phosphatilytica TaxID=657387 RepID=A0A1S1NRZ5_9GAMM|nr:MATE family efflux transporter [Kushneria phosphatilytica]OHV07668.1 MATE family efflux transporter [Kushneria phosphatilytica]QEL10163.1 MATE family efflux transporter [Kushneria phosphatilytica]
MSTTPTASRQRFNEIRRLAWPIIVSNISVPLLGLVDTAVVGHLPDPRYLAAVTLGATLFSFLFWGFGFLRMGTTGLAAQAYGAEDEQALRNLLGQALIIALGLGVALIALSEPLIELGLWLLHGEPDTRALAEGYAHIRILAAPAVLINYAIIGWFLGQQNSRVTLILMLTTNSLNIVLDLLFVLGFDMTSNGVAAASAIAEYATLGVGIVLVRHRLGQLSGELDSRPLKRWSAYATLFRVNRHLFVRTLCLLFAMAFFTSQGARLGDTPLAANAVLMQLVMMISYGLDGFANAAEALTGRAAGRHDWADFALTVRTCLLLSLITAGGAALVFAFWGSDLIALLTDLASVRDFADRYLGWVVIMPLIAVWSYLFDGVFIGATATRPMRDTLILALAVYLPVWWLTQPFGNHGLWLAFTVFTLVRSAGLGGVYLYRRRHDWR